MSRLRVVNRIVVTLVFVCVAMVVTVAAADVAAEPAPGPAFRPFFDLVERADALVTVRFVVKVQMPGVDQEAENEISCLLIDASGLVLCSTTELGGYFSVLSRLMGRSDAGISAAPTDIRVVTEAGDEYGADLVARDSDRDLAWLMLRDLPADAKLPYFDFSERAEPGIGDDMYFLRRMGPFFGSAPVVSEARVAAVIDQPRRLIVPSRADGRLGMPAFAADGSLLGIVVAQVPGNDDSHAVMTSRNRSLPGQPGTQNDMLAGVILPASDVVKATELARQVWAEDQADALE